MLRKIGAVALLLTFLVQAPIAWGAETGTPDEAKAMAERAAEVLKRDGAEKAFAQFADKAGPFRDRDLYVFVQDRAGMMVAHGANQALVGKPMINLRDVESKLFVQEMMGVKESGWIEYKWLHPDTKKVTKKKAYVIWVGDYQVGVGAYLP